MADGYRADVVAAWGDAMRAGQVAFEARALDAAWQAERFGYDCGFIARLPLRLGSQSSDHGLLCVNNLCVTFDDLADNDKSGAKNKKMTADKLNPVNTRPENHYGHILELIPLGGAGAEADHAADAFAWDLFVLAGNPKKAEEGACFHPDITEDGWFVNPDNLTFDPRGRKFVSTDGANDFDIADGVYGVDTEGPARGLPKLLFARPTGAEASGPCFTPDGTTLFVSVQHPAEDCDTLATASTRWPDFADGGVPRPAVAAIQRNDGGEVAA